MDPLTIGAGMLGTVGGVAVGFLLSFISTPKTYRFLMKSEKRGGETLIFTDEKTRRAYVVPVKQDSDKIKFRLNKQGYVVEKRAAPYRFGSGVLHFGSDFNGATIEPSVAAGATAMEGVLKDAGESGENMDPRKVVPFPDKVPVNGGSSKVGEGALELAVQDGQGGVIGRIIAARAQIAGAMTWDLANIVRYSIASVPSVELHRFTAIAEAAARHDAQKGQLKWMGPLLMVMCFGIVTLVLVLAFTGSLNIPGVSGARGPSGPPIP